MFRARNNVIEQRAKMEQLVKDYMNTFASPEGKKVLEHLSQYCAENRTCHAQGDPYQTAYNEGVRAVILLIRRMVNEDLSQPKETQTINESSQESR